MAPASSRLNHLPARPPTPPKDLSSDAVPPSSTSKTSAHTQPSPLLDTPITPTVLTTDYFSSKSPARGTKRKRVNFILTPTQSSSPPALPDLPSSSASKQGTPRSPSAGGGKPGKSILKVKKKHGLLSDITLSSDDWNIDLNFTGASSWKTDKAKMLSHVCAKLAEGDQSDKLDAYKSITQALKDYVDLPKRQDFLERVPTLVEHIRRDLGTRKGSDHRDGQVASEALKLATVIAWRNPSTLVENNKAVLLDFCIEVLKDETSSKMLTNNVLYLLKCQHWTKSLSTKRLASIFDALSRVPNWINGTQVKVLRMEVYRKLLTQCEPAVVVSNAQWWLMPLMEGLLFEKKELCAQALAFGREAAITLGTHKEMSLAVERLLERPMPSRDTDKINLNSEGPNAEAPPKVYADILEATLQRMTKDQTRGEMVPQIWSVIVLFLQRKRSTITKSPCKKNLLNIVQHCFNKSRLPVKTAAVVAWRDLIYTLHKDMHREQSTSDLLSMLFVKLFQRNDGEKARNAAEATLCTYLYYAFWPKATSETITKIWQDKVVKLLSRDQAKSQVRPIFSLRVLSALLGAYQQSAWDSQKALQKDATQPEDLPRIEPKWIASNLKMVFAVLKTYLKVSDSAPEEEVFQVWSQLCRCVVEVRQHEIRPSSATMLALAELMTFVQSHASNTTQASRLFTGVFTAFGSIPANEQVLWLDADDIVRGPETTVTSQDSSASKLSALDLAIGMLANANDRVAPEQLEHYNASLDCILRRKLEPAQTKSKRVQILADISTHSPKKPAPVVVERHTNLCPKALLWQKVCHSLNEALAGYASDSSHSSSGSQSHGTDFAYALDILASGIEHDTRSKQTWEQTWKRLLKEARASFTGSTSFALAIGIFEPMASVIAKDSHFLSTGIGLELVMRFLLDVEWPQEGETEREALTSLWGAPPAGVKGSSLDPYDNVYRLFASALRMSTSNGNEHLQLMASVVTTFIDACPAASFWNMMKNVTSSLASWLSKSNEQIVISSFEVLSRKLTHDMVENCGDASQLLEDLMVAGLEEAEEEIVSAYKVVWKKMVKTIFKTNPGLQITRRLSAALQTAETKPHRKLSKDVTEVPTQSQPPAIQDKHQSSGVQDASELPSEVPDTPSEDIRPIAQAPVTENHSFVAPAHASALLLNSTQIAELPEAVAATLEVTDLTGQAIEIPSSPPEVLKDAELPVVTDQANVEGITGEINDYPAMDMSDEFQRFDSSPSPFTRRPLAALRSDAGVFDLPDSSPVKTPARIRPASAPAGKTDSANKKARKAKRSERSSLPRDDVASKHFPIIVDKDEEKQHIVTPEEANKGPVARVQQTPEPTSVGRQSQLSPDPLHNDATAVVSTPTIDVSAIESASESSQAPRTRSQSRKRSLPETSEDPQPPAKRGRGRQRNNAQSISQPSLSVQESSQPQKRGSGRPRKNPIIAAALKRSTPSVVVNSDDDLEDTIEVASQPLTNSAQSSQQSIGQTQSQRRRQCSVKVVIPSSDGGRPLSTDQEENRPAAEGRESSVEIVRESFVADRPISTIPSGSEMSRTRSQAAENLAKHQSRSKTRNLRKRGNVSDAEHTTEVTETAPEAIKTGRKRKHAVDDTVKINAVDAAIEDSLQISQTAKKQKTNISKAKNRKEIKVAALAGQPEAGVPTDSAATDEDEHEQRITRRAVRSPSDQLREMSQPRTPIKFTETEDRSTPATDSSSPLSSKAQRILQGLTFILHGFGNAVFKRSEAKEATKLLNRISEKVLDSEAKE